MLGKQEHSARKWLPVFLGTNLYAVKWRNWKAHFIWQESMNDAPQKLAIPRLFDLYINQSGGAVGRKSADNHHTAGCCMG
jgi:hypothetical protein